MLFVAVSCAGGGLCFAQTAAVEFKPADIPAQIHSAKASARLFVAPVLTPGAKAAASVLDEYERGVAGVSVIVNGIPFDTNNNGIANLSIPNAGAVTISLKDQDQQEFAKRTFALVPGGFLANPDAGPFITKLMAPRHNRFGMPVIDYAPLAIEPGQLIVVVGEQFSDEIERGKLTIDGVDCPVLSTCPSSILALVPKRVPVGPIKQLVVAIKNGESSESIEIDVAQPRLVVPPEAREGKNVRGRIVATGTNVPVMIAVENKTPSVLTMTLESNNQEFKSKAVLVTPGGERNEVPVNLTGNKEGDFTVNLTLLPEIPELTPSTENDQSNQSNVELRKQLAKADVIRLKRRLIAVESRIAEDRKTRDSASTSSIDAEKLSSGLRALALRQAAIGSTLFARRCLFESLGASSVDYAIALDEAANGAYYVLEKTVAHTVFHPQSNLLDSSSIDARTLVNTRNRYSLLPVPRMKLLPPKGLTLLTDPDDERKPLDLPSPQELRKDELLTPKSAMPGKSPAKVSPKSFVTKKKAEAATKLVKRGKRRGSRTSMGRSTSSGKSRSRRRRR